MEEVWGVIEAAGTLEVRIDRVRVVIKGEGKLEATMDRGTHRVKMMEEDEWRNGRGGGGRGEGLVRRRGWICETSKGQSWRGDRLPWRKNYGAKRVG